MSYYFKNYNFNSDYVGVCVLAEESSRHTNSKVNHDTLALFYGDWVKILLAFRERLPCAGI